MIIRKLQKEDLETRVAWMNDVRVNNTLNIQIPVLLENTQNWFATLESRTNRVDMSFIQDGRIVAMGGFTDKDESTKKAELYIFVSPELQGKGYGTQAMMLLCKYGFEVFGLEKIYLHTNEDNLAAKRLYEKIGFKQEGYLRREAYHAGRIMDRYYFGLLKPEYKMGGAIFLMFSRLYSYAAGQEQYINSLAA